MDYLTTHTSLLPIRRRFTPGFVNYKKGALDSQLQVIKFTSCLPMVGGSLLVLPASSTTKTGHHDIAEILLKVALKHQKKSNQSCHDIAEILLKVALKHKKNLINLAMI